MHRSLLFCLMPILLISYTEPAVQLAEMFITDMQVSLKNYSCEDCELEVEFCGGLMDAPWSRKGCDYLFLKDGITTNSNNSWIIPILVRWPTGPWLMSISISRHSTNLMTLSHRFDHFDSLSDQREVHLTGYGGSANFFMDLECLPKMFGPSCAIFCDETMQDPFGGHFKCSLTGDRICDPGWSGPQCNMPNCKQGCVNGRCIGPNVCSCNRGWKGSACEECLPKQGCQHGFCHTSGECLCEPHWTGQHCNIEQDFCRHHPGHCMNGGTCSSGGLVDYFYCNCTTEFEGPQCENKKPITCSTIKCPTDRCSITLQGPICVLPTVRGDLDWLKLPASFVLVFFLLFAIILGFRVIFSKQQKNPNPDILINSPGRHSPPPSYSIINMKDNNPKHLSTLI